MIKRAWWLPSVLVALALGACTSNAAAPPSSSEDASTSVSPSVVDPPSSSVTSPTPSVIDPTEIAPPTTSGGVSVAPLPAGLTPEQTADAEAAVEVYKRFWHLSDESAGDPGRDWSEQIAAVATASAADSFKSGMDGLVADGIHLIGETAVEASVVKVEPALVYVDACVDVSGTDLIDGNGNSVAVDDGPGTYMRFPTSAQIAKFSGRWLVAVDTFDRTTTC